MKRSIRTLGILLIIIAIIFFLVNMGLLRFNYFQLLSNGEAEFSNDAFSKSEINVINVKASNEVVRFGKSEDDKIHFAYINSDKFFFEIVRDGMRVDVNLTDNVVWYDYFCLYMKIPLTIYIPDGITTEIYINDELIKNPPITVE